MYRKSLLLIVLLAALALPLAAAAQVEPAADSAADVSPLGTEFRISIADEEDLNTLGHSTSVHTIAMDADGDAVVLMFDTSPDWTLQARLYDKTGQPRGPQFLVTEYGLGDLRGADVAMDADGDFIVVWDGVYARLFNAAGSPKGPAFQLSVSATDVTTENVALAADDAGNFAAAWVSRNWAAMTYTVVARRFAADGSPRGAEIVVAPPVSYGNDYSYRYPDVAMDANGDFVVSWTWYAPGNCGSRVQRYSAAGAAEGGPIDLPGCVLTRLAADGVRNFVAVWVAPDQSEQGIFARRFLANGQPNGPQFQVNTATDSYQNDPTVAMNAAGEMYIAWTWDYREKRGEMEAGREVYGRRYTANGAPLGDQFRINSFYPGFPWGAHVAIDDQGDFLAAWDTSQQDGGNDGVYGQYNYPARPNIPILISLLGNGRVRGLSYMRGDIIKYDPASGQWSMYWDASAHGVATANMGDFELLNDGDLLLVFKSAVTLPGAGKVQPHDIVRFDAATGTYSLYFDGSDVGLTTLAERLDALAMEADGSLLLSTTGSYTVGDLTGVDEQTIRFQPAALGANTAGSWSMALYTADYRQFKDMWSLWVDTVSPDPYYYMTFEQPTRVDGGDILIPNGGVLRCRPFYPQGVPFAYGECISELYWSGAAAGLPATAKIDGLELLTR